MITGLVYSPRFLDHDTGPGHPESPARIKAVIDGLKKSTLWDQLDHLEPEISDNLLPELIHDPGYVKRVASSCDRGEQYIDTFDNPISDNSYRTALLAVNAATQGIDHIFAGKNHNSIVLPRPPGHHAEFNQAMGFCLFNNVAVAARYAQRQYSIDRIAIVDFDVHHGNGTQHIFEYESNIMYLSTHRYPFYPGTGARNETGRGDGLGSTINYPLDVGSGDSDYLDVFNNSMADSILSFQPELLILSAGFDAHASDPLGGMEVSTTGYGQLTAILKKIGQECCENRILSVLEGGYNLQGLADSVEAHIGELIKEES